MKKFKFSLESLLRYKTHMEHIAKQETATARASVNQCKERIDQCRDNIATTTKTLVKETEKGIKMERYKIHTDFLEGSEREAEYLLGELVNLNQILSQKQDILKQKSIEKKTIENLKDKKKDEYYKEMDKFLQKQTDDMIIVKKSREMGNF